jgi:CD63 antigen
LIGANKAERYAKTAKMTKEIDVGMKCIKYMLFVANFMFVMIGFLLISIGSTIKAIYGDFEVFMAQHYFRKFLPLL